MFLSVNSYNNVLLYRYYIIILLLNYAILTMHKSLNKFRFV